MSLEGTIIKTLDIFIYFLILFILIIIFLLELQYIGFIQYDTYAEFNMLLKIHKISMPKNIDRCILHLCIDDHKNITEYYVSPQFKLSQSLSNNALVLKRNGIVVSVGDYGSNTDIQILDSNSIRTTKRFLYTYNGDVFWIRSI